MLNEEEVIRHAVRKILKEEGEGWGLMDFGDIGGGMGGPNWITNDHLKQIGSAFAAPFQELFAGIERGVVHVKTLVKVALETVITSIIPFLNSDYKEIFEARDREIEQVNSKYAEVHKATIDVFKHKDFVFTAFLMAPAAFITTGALYKSPKAVVGFLRAVGGDYLTDVLKGFTGWFKEKKSHTMGVLGGRGGMYDSVDRTVGEILKEEPDRQTVVDQFKGDVQKKLRELMDTKEVKDALRSEKVQAMQKDASGVLLGNLEEVFKHCQKALTKAASFQELDKMSGGKVGQQVKQASKEATIAPKKDQKNEADAPSQQPGKVDTAQIEATLTEAARANVKQFYVAKLEEQLKKEIEEGVPSDHPYVEAAKKVIQRIKAL